MPCFSYPDVAVVIVSPPGSSAATSILAAGQYCRWELWMRLRR